MNKNPKNSLAFSNPIYGKISYRPIPKPRLSKKKYDQTKKQQNNDSSPVQEKQQQSLHDEQHRSSSLCLSDIHMTQLLEEINTLTDSLQKNFSSLPGNVDNSNNNNNDDDEQESNETTTTTTNTSNDEIQRRTIIKRKKIPVRSDLFNISFNNNDNVDDSFDDNVNTINPLPSTSLNDVLKSETDKPITSSGDSGVFLMASQKSVFDNDGDGNQENNSGTNMKNQSEIDEIATTMKESIKSETKSIVNIKQTEFDEPPKLPPRKPSRSGRNCFCLSFCLFY